MRNPILVAYLDIRREEIESNYGDYDPETELKHGVLYGITYEEAKWMERIFDKELKNVKAARRDTSMKNKISLVYGIVLGVILSALVTLVLETYIGDQDVLLAFIFTVFAILSAVFITSSSIRRYAGDIRYSEEIYSAAKTEVEKWIEEFEKNH